MNYLLDTHTFLWWITDDERLSKISRDLIAEGQNRLFLSAISGLEIAIKAQIGRLELPSNPIDFIQEQVATNAFMNLPLQLKHTLHVYTLPMHHRDPFDRVLVAQSQIENMPILSADPILRRYPVEIIW
ncbi:MAG: type II toxin-antitoxin system VapC family toxin [Anaerolineales bacterium]|nr:type II toxin-antitoxin system VapC family toxin [Chloroflexota bacterium]MBL7161121.1 type II toxin-antitoxin system VapC family toxin [Anaerolineales bacterium]